MPTYIESLDPYAPMTLHVDQGATPSADAPTLYVRISALHRQIDQIEAILNGDDPDVPHRAQDGESLGNLRSRIDYIGAGLDKATSRLQQLRTVLDMHMRQLA